MKRPTNWLQSSLCAVIVWVLLCVVFFAWAAPRAVEWALSVQFGEHLSTQSVRLVWPNGLQLTKVVFKQPDERSGASVQRMDIRFAGMDWTAKTLYFSLFLEQPSLRITRLDGGGAITPEFGTKEGAEKGFWARLMRTGRTDKWKISLKRAVFADGAMDILDLNTSPPIRSIVQHMYSVISPVQKPYASQPLAFSASAEVIGHLGYSAPARCSGWLALKPNDAEFSCHLEPLRITAFQPYFDTFGRFTVREYASTVQVTTDWLAREGIWDRRFQIVLDHAEEADVSFRGRTVVDFKELARNLEATFEGEISMGETERDADGRIPALFTPGNEVAQRLVKFFIEHNRPSLDLRFFGLPLRVFLKRATESEMDDIQELTREIQDGLEMLVFPMSDSQVPEGGAPGDEEYYGPFLPQTPEEMLRQEGAKPNRNELQGAQPAPVHAPAPAH